MGRDQQLVVQKVGCTSCCMIALMVRLIHLAGRCLEVDTCRRDSSSHTVGSVSGTAGGKTINRQNQWQRQMCKCTKVHFQSPCVKKTRQE